MSLEVKSMLNGLKRAEICWCSCFLGLALLFVPSVQGADLTFPTLTAGTLTYSNVTVTSRAPSYIVISHAQGMASIKLKDLSLKLLKELGYQVASPAAEAQPSIPPRQFKLDPRIKELWDQTLQQAEDQINQVNPLLVKGALGGLLLLFLLFSYCIWLICKKTGHAPGGLAWLPILQIFPLLKAAGMSAWWFLANIVAFIVWCLRICQARGKSPWLAVLLLLPGTNVLAFLYLAFADGPGDNEDGASQRITFD